ncbi:hypothetical protein KIL84_002558 [Mauremys mutica]|uniref:Uncharacterized protein n=1 Tax=Mauremys mutica TaxID=74926 RepID=A0A9D3X2T8_9SAUR|nr:hypothetical protein KIL84_002558 [Mauremys mutica]
MWVAAERLLKPRGVRCVPWRSWALAAFDHVTLVVPLKKKSATPTPQAATFFCYFTDTAAAFQARPGGNRVTHAQVRPKAGWVAGSGSPDWVLKTPPPPVEGGTGGGGALSYRRAGYASISIVSLPTLSTHTPNLTHWPPAA